MQCTMDEVKKIIENFNRRLKMTPEELDRETEEMIRRYHENPNKMTEEERKEKIKMIIENHTLLED